MNNTFSDQIVAIRDAMGQYPKASRVYEALNDAASTIAAMNLTKDLPKREPSLVKEFEFNRDEYFEELLDLTTRHIEANDYRTECEIKEQILRFIKETSLPEYDGPNSVNH